MELLIFELDKTFLLKTNQIKGSFEVFTAQDMFFSTFALHNEKKKQDVFKDELKFLISQNIVRWETRGRKVKSNHGKKICSERRKKLE